MPSSSPAERPSANANVRDTLIAMRRGWRSSITPFEHLPLLVAPQLGLRVSVPLPRRAAGRRRDRLGRAHRLVHAALRRAAEREALDVQAVSRAAAAESRDAQRSKNT